MLILLVTLALVSHAHSQCCPEGAWGSLKNTDYEPLGSIHQLDGFDVYHVGKTEKCIIWNYDIFGFDSGRTKQMADFLAAHEYTVLLPDYYRGTFHNPAESPSPAITFEFLKNETDWNGRLKEDFLKVKQFAIENLGCNKLGAIGTCWGSYPVIRMSEDVDIKAGVSMHPSHPNIIQYLEENEEEILKNVKSPQLFLPSGSDPESVQLGGLGKEIMGDALEIVPFPDMRHGWTVRGDLSDPQVERDVKRAFNLVLAFFGKYL